MTTEHDAAVERRAYQMAYAPLRSAQHAFDLIHRRTGDTLAKEESARIGQAIAALATTPPRDDAWPAEANFHMGDLVQKKQRSKWRGPVVGFYSTEQTPIGYVVESAYETGSVQAWPEAALIAWDGARAALEPQAELK